MGPAVGILILKSAEALGVTAAAAAAYLATPLGRAWAQKTFGDAAGVLQRGAETTSRVARAFDGTHGIARPSVDRSRVAEADATRVARPDIVATPSPASVAVSRMMSKKNKKGLSTPRTKKQSTGALSTAGTLPTSQTQTGTLSNGKTKSAGNLTNSQSNTNAQSNTNTQSEGTKPNGNLTSGGNKYLKFWEGSGNSTGGNPNFWRYVRNGLRLGLYGEVVTPTFDLLGNVAGASAEPDNFKHLWNFPVTRLYNTVPIGVWNLMKKSYRSDSIPEKSSKDSVITVTNLPPEALKDSSLVVSGDTATAARRDTTTAVRRLTGGQNILSYDESASWIND